MTNKKTTKRALLSSIVALFLCFSMLLGTTYAWFTDSVTSANSIIVSGNLDVDLEYAAIDASGAISWNTVTERVKLFDEAAKWEPGRAEIVYLKVSNLGTLALKYQLTVNVGNEISGTNVDGDPFKLSDYLVFKVVEIDENMVGGFTREAAVAAAGTSMGLASVAGELHTLEAIDGTTVDADYVALVIYMPTTVNNVANHMPGTTAPSVELGVSLFATQVEAEFDSFGDDYDADSPMPSVPVERPDAGEVVLTSNDETVSVSLPASVVAQLPQGVTSMGLSVSDPVVDTTANTITFASIEVVDQNGDVIDLENYTGVDNVTITLPAQTTFAAGETVVIYHDGAIVASAVVAADGTIAYDVAHLCEVKVGATVAPTVAEDGTIQIGTAAELYYFADSVNAGESYSGKTVVLTADIDLGNANWTPIGDPNSETYVGFQGTFDGQGHTISNLKVEADTWGLGLFGYMAKSCVVTNLNINNAYVKGTDCNGVVVGYATTGTFTNIAVTGDVTVIGTAADGHVGGIAGCGYNAEFSGCSVIANDGSVITSNGPFNAGIVGYQCNKTKTITNCQVKNVTITGNTAVGGIAGVIAAGTTVSGCSVEDVVLNKTKVGANPSIGLITGCYDGASYTTFTNNTVKNVTLNGNSIKYDAYNMYAGSEYSSKTPADFDLTGTTAEGITNNLIEVVIVTTADELVAALKAGKNVVLGNDITLAATSGGYKKSGINVTNGQILDGNGKTLTVTGAGGTWDCAIYTNGGTIKNITVAGAMRGIFTAGSSADIIIDNVIFKNVIYTFNSDDGNGQYGVYISNTQMNGWTSYSAVHKEVVFENCTFAKGSGYQKCRPYMDTTFINCDFAEGFDKIENSEAAIFENCTFGGTLITADNVANFVKNADKAIVK